MTWCGEDEWDEEDRLFEMDAERYGARWDIEQSGYLMVGSVGKTRHRDDRECSLGRWHPSHCRPLQPATRWRSPYPQEA